MKSKVYFFSDSHLGSVSHLWNKSDEELDTLKQQGIDPLLHVQHILERKMCRFLDRASKDAKAIYMLGDIFDYWFEYKNVIPRGFTRFLGKLAQLHDMGIELHFFIGNHDIWFTDYLKKECGLIIYREPTLLTINGKKMLLGHGDGLGDDSKSFMFLRKLFHSSFCRVPFAALHPRWTVGFAHGWSDKRRANYAVMPYKGENNEPLITYAKDRLKKNNDIDFFIFGHRHIMLDLMLAKNSRIVLLGDWIAHCSYAVYDGENMTLETFELESTEN